MKLRGIIASAIALVLSLGFAQAQTGQGASPLSIIKGGTGASTASQARTNLGLAIGSATQAWDADLDALAALSGTNTIYYRSASNTWTAVTIGGMLTFSGGTLNVGDAELSALAGLTSANNKCFYWTGSGTSATYDCTSFGRSVQNAADASALRTLAGSVIGTDVQAYDAELAAIAGLTSAANKLSYWTGSGTAALADFSSAMRTFFTTSSSANLAAVLTDETGTGPAMFGNAPQVQGLFDVNGAIKFSVEAAPSQITSNQNNYNPSSTVCASSTTILINSDAARDITGLAGGVQGCWMRLINNGSFTITLKEESASSTAGNRFKTGGDIQLVANAGVTLIYEGTGSRWRMSSPASTGGGSGTVTSVVCGTGLSGGTITTSGTCSLDPTYQRGYISGLTLSNDAGDTTNDIGIAVGVATSDDQTALMKLTSALIKRTDASWTVGTNQGCGDTGAMSNGPVNFFLIERLDTFVVDVLCSASSTAPTMPTNYTVKRRIGIVERASAAMRLFTQNGEVFKLSGEPSTAYGATASFSDTLTAIAGVPTGVALMPMLSGVAASAASGNCALLMDDATIASAGIAFVRSVSSTAVGTANGSSFVTDTSARLRITLINASGTACSTMNLFTLGYIDGRGK